MALVAGRQDIEFRETGTAVLIPNNPTARLMFYLKCMNSVMDLQTRCPSIQKLLDFRNWHLLNDGEFRHLLIWCIVLAPDTLIGLCIFQNDEACGDRQNAFCEVSTANTNSTVSNGVVISGKKTEIRKIMFFKESFLIDNYYIPMIYYKYQVNIIKRATADVEENRNAARSSCCNIL